MKFNSSILSSIILLASARTNAFTITSHPHSSVSPKTTTTPPSPNTELYAKKNDKKKSKNSTSSSSPSSSKGFGTNVNKNRISVSKTYGSTFTKPIADVIDVQAAMEEFFGSNEDYHPLFRSIVDRSNVDTGDDGVPAMDFLKDGGESILPLSTYFDPTNESSPSSSTSSLYPWSRLPQVPTGDEDKMAIVATFLDSVQQALLDIPVNQGSKEDSDDLHFIEEGRRCLILSRFQVLNDATTSLDRHDLLFSTCWSEISCLLHDDREDNGSLIILPDAITTAADTDTDSDSDEEDGSNSYEMTDLRRFVDQNILRPLEWMGLGDVFEVASLRRDSMAIRLIYKLSDIPVKPAEE